MTRLKLVHGIEVRLLPHAPGLLLELKDIAANLYDLQGRFELKYVDEDNDQVVIETEREYSSFLARQDQTKASRLYISQAQDYSDSVFDRPDLDVRSEFFDQATQKPSERGKIPASLFKSDKFQDAYESKEVNPAIVDKSRQPVQSMLGRIPVLEANSDEDESRCIFPEDTNSAEIPKPEYRFLSDIKYTDTQSDEASLGSNESEEEEFDVIPLPETTLEESKMVSAKVAASLYNLNSSKLPITASTLPKLTPEFAEPKLEFAGQGTATQTAMTAETSSNTEPLETKEQESSSDIVLHDIGCEALVVEVAEVSSGPPEREQSERAIETVSVEAVDKSVDDCGAEMVDSASDAVRCESADASTFAAAETNEYFSSTSKDCAEVGVHAVQSTCNQASDAFATETHDSSVSTMQVETVDQSIDIRRIETHEVSVSNQAETNEICLGTKVETSEASMGTLPAETIDQNCGDSVEFKESGCDAHVMAVVSTETQIVENCTVATDPKHVELVDISASAVCENFEVSTETVAPTLVEAWASTDIKKDFPEIDERTLNEIRAAIRVEFCNLRNCQLEVKAEVHKSGCMKCAVNPIRGPRYVCVDCPDVSLCSICEELQSHPHALLKLRSPTQLHLFQELTLSKSSQSSTELIKSISFLSSSAIISEQVDKIAKMGFQNLEDIIRSLAQNDNDMNRAVDALLNDQLGP